MPEPKKKGLVAAATSGVRPDEIREDQTLKAQGFFGPLQHSSGKMSTELSVAEGEPTSRAYTHKGDILYPSLVPGMSKQQMETALSGGQYTPEMYDLAYYHARSRLAQGKSPFATPGEQYPAPGYEDQFMKAYPSAVMSYPNQTAGYQYYAGAPVTPYLANASKPAPVPSLMSVWKKTKGM